MDTMITHFISGYNADRRIVMTKGVNKYPQKWALFLISLVVNRKKKQKKN